MDEEKEYLGGCIDFCERFNIPLDCCDSCHDDQEMGYVMPEIELKNGYYAVCCRVNEKSERITNRNV